MAGDNHENDETPPDGDEESETKRRGGGCCERSLMQEMKQGWVPILGVFGINFLMVGYAKSFAIIYLIMRHRFGSSATATSWVSGLQTLLRMGLGPLASIAVNRFGLRPTAIAGGALYALGAITCSFADNLATMYLTYGVMIGLGGSLTYLASFIVIGEYFDKHRTFAYGISNCGYSVGIFVFPIISDRLIDLYGNRGYLLISGAFLLNSIVCCALYRPKLKRNPVSDVRAKARVEQKTSLIHHTKHGPIINVLEENHRTKSLEEVAMKQQRLVRNGSFPSGINEKPTHLDVTGADKIFKMDEFGSGYMLHRSIEFSANHRESIHRSKTLSENRDDWSNLEQGDGIKSKQSVSSAQKIVSKCQVLSEFMFPFVTLLKNPLFLSLGILAMLQSYLYSTFYPFIKAMAINNGIDSDHATLLISVTGLVDLAGNLILPPLFDSRLLRHHRIHTYLFCSFTMSVTFALVPLFHDIYRMTALLCVAYFFASQAHTMRVPLAIEMTDAASNGFLPNLIGCLTFFCGAGNALGPTIGGQIVDNTGDYRLAFYVAGIVVTVYSVFYWIHNMVSTRVKCSKK